MNLPALRIAPWGPACPNRSRLWILNRLPGAVTWSKLFLNEECRLYHARRASPDPLELSSQEGTIHAVL
jgi:hypothetical protein